LSEAKVSGKWMQSFRDVLIDRMKTGWGRFVLASYFLPENHVPQRGTNVGVSPYNDDIFVLASRKGLPVAKQESLK
jgi:hypothetical protein